MNEKKTRKILLKQMMTIQKKRRNKQLEHSLSWQHFNLGNLLDCEPKQTAARDAPTNRKIEIHHNTFLQH